MTWAVPTTPGGSFATDFTGDGNSEAVDNSGSTSVRYSMGNEPIVSPVILPSLFGYTSFFHRITYQNGVQTKDEVINAWPLSKLEKFVAAKRAR